MAEEITLSPKHSAKAAPKEAKSNWLIRLSSWEYWPFGLVYLPIFLYWAWLSLRARSFFFFTAANPSIPFGGMRGESKIDLYELVPKAVQPLTRLIPAGLPQAKLADELAAAGLEYPIIVKPDIGERGTLVEKLDHEAALHTYHAQMQVPYLIQEYIDLPLELGVFYYRLPNEEQGVVSSIVVKELLSVTGDGQHTLAALIRRDDRAKLQESALALRFAEQWEQVLPAGEELLLMPIGNHCRGTAFLDGNAYIDTSLCQTFDALAQQIEGFYFGRFDLRCASIEDLKRGQNYKVMELNGAGAEPGHIYQPGYSLWQAWKDIIYHLDVLCTISIQNHRSGVPYMSLSAGLRFIRQLNGYYKRLLPKA